MTNFITEDASQSFLDAIAGLTDPQKKRMAVGENFITVRDRVVEAQHLDPNKWMLAQGTLYPDIIESGGTKNSHTIKTHHNRVQGIQELIAKGMIIEPVRDLYKDEVRAIGKKLGLPDELVMRHPFPGPGLSINVLCSDGQLSDKDKEEIQLAQKELDNITLDMFCEKCSAGLKRSILPVRSVGVQGDFRTYRFPALLEFAEEGPSTSSGTAKFYHFPGKREKLEACSSTITNSAKYINRTCVKLFQRANLADSDLKIQQGYTTKDRLDQLRKVDNIVLTELHKSGWYDKIFQHLTIILPYASTPDHSTFVLRPVVSEDVMTARFAMLDKELLQTIVHQIAELPFVDALYFDATNKPPATFGWE